MEDRKESIKKALLTIKKECSRYDECEDGQCIVLELLPSLDICPLQLDVIQRGIELWSNPGDIVLDPFAGIGSSIYQALLMNRKGVGIELKDSYFKQAKLNCENAAKKVEERANEITMEDYIKRMMAN